VKKLIKITDTLAKRCTFAVVALCWSWLPLIDAAAISNNRFVATMIALFVYAVIVGLQSVIIYSAYKFFQKYKPAQNWVQLAAVFFVSSFLLWFLAWITCFIWYGEGASVDNMLPFTSLTPFLVFTPLKFLAQVFGYHGTTAVIATVTYAFFVQMPKKIIFGLITVILTANTVSWLAYRTPSGQSVSVHLTSQQIGQPQYVTSSADLLLLPEYGLDDITNTNLASRIGGEASTTFIGSKQTYTDHGNQNTLLIGTVGSGIVEQRQKSRLIVGGEYLAYTVEPWLKVLTSNTVTNFEVSRKVIRGNDGVKTTSLSNGVMVGPAVCSSMLSTEDYRSLTKHGAELLTNSASLEIFRGSRLFAWQHRGFAKFMAVANARPFAQSSNNWPAFALDNNGNEVAEIQPSSDKQISLTTNRKKTPYTTLGEWPVVISGCVLVVYLLRKTVSKRLTS
jgi:apolipoprotein N-acyltransferase